MRQALVAAALFIGGIGTTFAQSVESDVTPESADPVKADHDFSGRITVLTGNSKTLLTRLQWIY